MSSTLLQHTAACIQAIVSSPRVQSAPWSTSIPALDHVLGGGIPRGRITEIIGPLAVGKSTLLRRLVGEVLSTGSWVAWIDATRTLAPAPWVGLGERFVAIRLPTPGRSAWTADLLLRSGIFGLVVIDGAPPLSRIHGIRLTQLARDRDAACVVVDHIVPDTARAPRLTGTIRLSVALHTRSDRYAGIAQQDTSTPVPHMQVTVEKGGLITGKRLAIEVDRVDIPRNMAHRLRAHSEVPDRRGVAHGTRRPWVPRDTDSAEHRHAATVSGGGIGVVTHDVYGIGVSGPAHFAITQRQADQRQADERRHIAESQHITEDASIGTSASASTADTGTALHGFTESDRFIPTSSLASALG